MKKPHQSITLWVNFLILLLSMFDAEFFKLMGLSEHQAMVVLAIIVKAVAALNLILRVFFTHGAISFKNQSNQ